MTQQVRLWEVSPDQQLAEITSDQIPLEERLEDWLESDISVLDHKLLGIGWQVRTDFGGEIDLLCLDRSGDTVVVELKKSQTPREVNCPSVGLRIVGQGPVLRPNHRNSRWVLRAVRFIN